ncbi:sugar-transfer associated ATP-grasp domain-containing protein [Alkalicoccus chagannorensis]|uniref:sugar-transfer associated ATP-grasp domain-containing protein n=1 Tax=Alkalicoccus chagannorensis TaxID=427072 RepID=UPI000413C91A|nr:sugar-transfer associated ATP-grasp domain-containing protein [Alkalicoccus chagannorensis]
MLKTVDYHKSLNINTESSLYKDLIRAGWFRTIDENHLEDVQKFFLEHYGSEIDPSIHIIFNELYGVKKVNLIPNEIGRRDALPILNPGTASAFFSDKNLYDLFLTKDHYPVCLVKCVEGDYFNQDNEPISKSSAYKLFFENKKDLIVKHSYSDDGKNIELLHKRGVNYYLGESEVNLNKIKKAWGDNFVVQKKIKQHTLMASPHPSSVNTLRMVTLRRANKINYILTHAKFGAEGSIKDNSGQGGIAVAVHEDGSFADFGMDKKFNLYYEHPTTNYPFNKLPSIPNYEEVIAFAKMLHKKIPHKSLASWDIAINHDGSPIFIEVNFAGALMHYQFRTGSPLFGEFTEEILKEIKSFKEEKNIALDKYIRGRNA